MFNNSLGGLLSPSAWLRRFYSQGHQDSTLLSDDVPIDHLLGAKEDLPTGVIPLLFGRARIRGKVLLAACKGQSKDHVVAIGICKGPAELRAIYVNGQVLDLNPHEYRFYEGNETQEPDPVVASVAPLGCEQSFRGLAYIVFDRLSLEKFGGKLPTFRFDMVVKSKANRAAKISGVNIIPGSGEFVYDTRPIVKLQSEAKVGVNSADNKVANSVANLNFLKRELPGVSWVAPVVCWFATDLDIYHCKVLPKVESNSSRYASAANKDQEIIWSVQGRERSEVEMVGEEGKRYGGTPSDDSVISYLQKLKEKGYKVMLYPMLLVDAPGKPWRGSITGHASFIPDFFNKEEGYNNFILHYAQLAKDYIDAFVIGSEFPALSGIFAENSLGKVFPAVSEFINLARQVRSIFQGRDIKITYAADWSEYHHTDGGWYHMDPLWMCESIDVIGIDVYFPLTQTYISSIKRGDIEGGYSSLSVPSEHIGRDWLLGDIQHWWENEHFNPNGEKTVWKPKAKKIWLTEFGFPSVDKSTNEPNKFPDSKSLDGGYPVFSSKGVDFAIQEEAILSAIAHFERLECIQKSFLWCWDARYPFWPSDAFRCQFQKDVNLSWDDDSNWITGHWVNGKLSNICLSEVLEFLLLKAGFEKSEFVLHKSTKNLISGFVADYRCSMAQLLRVLSLQYGLNIRVNAQGQLEVSAEEPMEPNCQLTLDELMCDAKLNLFHSLTASEVLGSVSLSFIDEVTQRRTLVEVNSGRGTKSLVLASPISMPQSKASAMASQIMERSSCSEQTISIKVHPDCPIRTADLVRLTDCSGASLALIKVVSVRSRAAEKDIIGNLRGCNWKAILPI